MTTAGNRIRQMRRRRGLTLKQVADAIRPEPTTPQTIAMTDPVYIGLAVCSHVADQLGQARFSNIRPGTPPAVAGI